MTHYDQIDVRQEGEQSTRAAPQFDPAKYKAEIDCFDLTEAQKQDLLMTLWSIMRSFVELGFTVDVCAALLDDALPVPSGNEAR